jgi:CheY-like chemotaxis protein
VEVSKKTILVVENDFLLRRVICEALEDAGFHTIAAASCPEAKRRLGQEAADLVLTRLHPLGDGKKFRDEISHDPEFALSAVVLFATTAAEAAAAGEPVIEIARGPEGIGRLIDTVRLRLGEPATA